jgi:hypothetical protein
MPSSFRGTSGVLRPNEIADLSDVFCEACRLDMTPVDTEVARIIAMRLLSAHRAGVRNRALLAQLATVKVVA